MWEDDSGTEGTVPNNVALYLPRECAVETIVDVLDRFGCRFRFLSSPADVHRCFVDGTALLAVVHVGAGAGVGWELLQGYRKVHGSGNEPFLVAVGDERIATRRAAWLAGAGEFLQLPLTVEHVAERMQLAIRTARWLDGFRRDRYRLQHEVKQSARKLHDARLEIARLLGRAAEFRDNETGRHVLRVSRSCEAVARELHRPEDEVNAIAQASPLHDIGKIGVPDSILLKPGPLTGSEWRQMKRHTVIGARILSNTDDPLIVVARTIALTHHERWDGGGYPRRLRGTNIPLAGRIVAVCDAFDALTSTRPYKAPWTVDAAFTYVATEAGAQFDPDVAAAFLRVGEQVADIRAENADQGECIRSRGDHAIGLAPSVL